jgi:hypothetical protein
MYRSVCLVHNKTHKSQETIGGMKRKPLSLTHLPYQESNLVVNLEGMHPVVLIQFIILVTVRTQRLFIIYFILLGVTICFGLSKPSSGSTISNY